MPKVRRKELDVCMKEQECLHETADLQLEAFVEAMGGSIMVDSEYEHETVYTVIIPAVPGDKDSEIVLEHSGKEPGTEESFLDALADISEINAQIGMSHFSDLELMYRDTMALFNKNLRKVYEKLSVYLDKRDIINFMVSIHAMKSMLSTVGAMKLSDMARKLELAAKEEDAEYCVSRFPELKEKLVDLDERLTAVFSGTA
ncbi:MAG: Hpt domain-containing protein [Oscillospiraceae bacterium]|jgi:HPt (histidine-containing phosphotransfer) domain-containing protein|nr:Hpt domain-containing protein [Oscillospiraceae bacterium]